MLQLHRPCSAGTTCPHRAPTGSGHHDSTHTPGLGFLQQPCHSSVQQRAHPSSNCLCAKNVLLLNRPSQGLRQQATQPSRGHKTLEQHLSRTHTHTPAYTNTTHAKTCNPAVLTLPFIKLALVHNHHPPLTSEAPMLCRSGDLGQHGAGKKANIDNPEDPAGLCLQPGRSFGALNPMTTLAEIDLLRSPRQGHCLSACKACALALTVV